MCPGWVRTGIMDAARNWPARLGDAPPPSFTAGITGPHVRRAIDDAITPAAVADLVADAIADDRFWVFTEQQFVELVVRRWHGIAEGANPEIDVDVPGLPPYKRLAEEIRRLLAGLGDGG